jgi:hypothetical protein
MERLSGDRTSRPAAAVWAAVAVGAAVTAGVTGSAVAVGRAPEGERTLQARVAATRASGNMREERGFMKAGS